MSVGINERKCGNFAYEFYLKVGLFPEMFLVGILISYT